MRRLGVRMRSDQARVLPELEPDFWAGSDAQFAGPQVIGVGGEAKQPLRTRLLTIIGLSLGLWAVIALAVWVSL